MNFRALIVAAVGLGMAATLACGPKQGTSAAQQRYYAGPGRDVAAGTSGRWWELHLDFAESRFEATFSTNLTAQTTWRGSVAAFGSEPGMLKLVIEDCGGDTVTCSTGRELYAYEYPEVALQLTDPLLSSVPITLIAPQDCEAFTGDTIRYVASVFDSAANPFSTALVGSFSATPNGSGQWTVAAQESVYTVAGAIGASVASLPLTAVCVSGRLVGPIGTPTFIAAGNSETGLYAAYRASAPIQGSVGMSGADSLGTGDFTTSTKLLGFGKASIPTVQRCPNGTVPTTATSAFEVFQLTGYSSTQLYFHPICDLSTMDAVSTEASNVSFRFPAPGWVDISPQNSGVYHLHGFAKQVGARKVVFTLEAVPSPTQTPGEYRAIVERRPSEDSED